MSRRRQRKLGKKATATTSTKPQPSSVDEWSTVSFTPQIQIDVPKSQQSQHNAAKTTVATKIISDPDQILAATTAMKALPGSSTKSPPPTLTTLTSLPKNSPKTTSTPTPTPTTTPTTGVMVDINVDAVEEDEMMELPITALSLTMRGAPKYIMLKDQPVKIQDVRMKKKSTNKGNDRIEIKGTHVRTGKLYQDTIVGTVLVPVLKVKFSQYTLLDVDSSDGSVSVMDDEGNVKEDVVLIASPDTTDPFDTVGMDTIRRNENGESLVVIVFSVLGRDVVVEVKKDEEEDES